MTRTTASIPRSPARIPPAVPAALRPMAVKDVVVRPAGLTRTAVAVIAHGVAILMWVMFGLTRFLGEERGTSPAMDAIHRSAFLNAWTIGAWCALILLAFLAISSAMGALSLRTWARRGLFVWAIGLIVLSVATVAVDLLWIFPLWTKLHLKPRPVFHITPAVGDTLIVLCNVVWPAFVLWLMRRRNVMDAFRRARAGVSVL